MSTQKSKPQHKPDNPNFSSGPCAKYPGWSLTDFNRVDWLAMHGRSHRSPDIESFSQEIIQKTRILLNIPDDYWIGMTPGSDTGAFEMALWQFLGAPNIGVDVYSWDVFGHKWADDIERLPIQDRRIYRAEYGELPSELADIDPDRDSVFTWNGTTAGVMIPQDLPTQWPDPQKGQGLRICDAISAVFAVELPWQDLDIVTWSWQKTIGSEAQHGMIVLSPKAQQRLKNHQPDWPIPALLSLKNNDGSVRQKFFSGYFNNTPSILCLQDIMLSLEWAAQHDLKQRSRENFQIYCDWLEASDWCAPLAKDKKSLSVTSPCAILTHPEVLKLSSQQQTQFLQDMVTLLADEKAAFDILGHRKALPNIRCWIGPTHEKQDIISLTQWLDWSFHQTLSEYTAHC